MSKPGIFKRNIGRQRGSVNLPTEYIQDHMEDKGLSPAIVSPPLEYVSRLNSFTTSENKEELERQEYSLFSNAREELQRLKEAVVEYNRKTHQRFNVESNLLAGADTSPSSWQDIKEGIELAKANEDGQDIEAWSARGSCDKMVDNLSALETWLDLLPGGDYGAIVSGVFKMVVGAAKTAQNIRIIVFEALADIPYWVGRANRYRDLYAEAKPQELVQTTAQLCSAVLIALRHIMVYLTEGTLKKAWKAMTEGQAYKQHLRRQVERVRMLSVKVDEEAGISLQYRLKDLQQHVSRELRDVRETQNRQNGTGVRLDEATQQELAYKIAKATLNGIHSLLISNPSVGTGIRAPSRMIDAQPSAAPANLETSKKCVSQESLFTALHSSQEAPQQDLKRCLRLGPSLSLTNQDRVKWMLQSRKLQEWLNSPRSRAVLINGNSDGNEMVSSTTCLSAKLLESLGHIEPILSQHFFCSLHTSFGNDVKDDATGLVKSFVIQLLLRDTVAWDLSFLSQADLEKVERDDLESICELFRNLVQQLPRTTFVFWTIDGINYYERSGKRQDFVTVIHELLDIIKSCNTLVIKLLMTSHSRSSYVKEMLEEDDILTVPLNVDGSRQGWSERAFQNRIEHEIRKS